MRTISEKDCLALKGSTEASLALGGGMTSFTHFTRVGIANLSKYASIRDEQFMPIDIAVEADMRAGSPVVVGEMARQLGYRLERLEDAPSPSHKLTESDGTMVTLEAADVVRALHEGKVNTAGDLDDLSRRRVLKEAYELKRVAERIIAALVRAAS